MESVVGRRSNPSPDARVCPFELASDVSRWVDVVVCDYNHVFDPVFGKLRQLWEKEAFTWVF
ncbi:MAG: hypothetical protein Ct9H300mP8_09720 [Gammaproteobacteria bacterium]|nr:MAG: hypothetical protein Ct9H300mP8_09720 [Gammaproteobacteria bacterium]